MHAATLSSTHLFSYLWYCQTVSTSSASSVTLSITNSGDLVYVFINGTLYGQLQEGQSGAISWKFNVPAGTHQLQILTLTVGLVRDEAVTINVPEFVPFAD